MAASERARFWCGAVRTKPYRRGLTTFCTPASEWVQCCHLLIICVMFPHYVLVICSWQLLLLISCVRARRCKARGESSPRLENYNARPPARRRVDGHLADWSFWPDLMEVWLKIRADKLCGYCLSLWQFIDIASLRDDKKTVFRSDSVKESCIYNNLSRILSNNQCCLGRGLKCLWADLQVVLHVV